MDYAARDRNPTLPRSRARRRIHFSAKGVTDMCRFASLKVSYRYNPSTFEELAMGAFPTGFVNTPLRGYGRGGSNTMVSARVCSVAATKIAFSVFSAALWRRGLVEIRL